MLNQTMLEVTYYGGDVSKNLRAAEKIYVDKSVREIPEKAFAKCINLREVRFDPSDSQLKIIGKDAFGGTGVSAVDIPASVTEIREGAFGQNTALTRVTFASDDSCKLQKIGERSFVKTGISTIRIPASVQTIGNKSFTVCHNLTDVKFASDDTCKLESIGDYAFYQTAVSSIKIPASVTKIGSCAFRECKDLTEVTFASDDCELRSIGDHAFYQTSISSLEVQKSVEEISKNAFSDCQNLTSVSFASEDSKLRSICELAFSQCSRLAIIPFPRILLDLEDGFAKNAFRECRFEAPFVYKEKGQEFPDSITYIVVHPSVKEIPDFAFEECHKLKRIELPSSLVRIGRRAFRNCSSLRFVKVPDSVTEIGWKVFPRSIEVVILGSKSKLEKVNENSIEAGMVEFPESCKVVEGRSSGSRVRLESGWDTNLHDGGPVKKVINESNTDLHDIHRLAYFGAPLTEDSNALKQLNDEGMTPLHMYFLCGHCKFDVVKQMVKNFPEAVSLKDKRGRYPIHYYCWIPKNIKPKNEVKILYLLIRKFTGVRLSADDDGMTPFSYALSHFSEGALQYLYSIEPVAAFGPATKLISHFREKYLEDLYSVKKLRKALKRRAQQNGWARFVAVHIRLSEEDKLLKFIKDENKCDKTIVEGLAYAKTFDKRSALEIATPRIKTALQERLLFLGRYAIAEDRILHKSETCLVVEGKDAKIKEYYEKLFDKHSTNGYLDVDQCKKLLKVIGTSEDICHQAKELFKNRSDGDRSIGIRKDELVDFCLEKLPEKVAVKFIKQKSQFVREIEMRQNLEAAYVMGILRAHVPKDWNEEIENDSDMIKKDIDVDQLPAFTMNFFSGFAQKDQEEQEKAAKEYRYILVMFMGDRTLDSIFRSEQPNIEKVRKEMRNVGMAMEHFHKNKIVHGDLNMLNIVRDTGVLKLIDLDASEKISTPTNRRYIHSKFSSGVLPPEAIHRIAKDDWNDDLRKQLKKLEETGAEIGLVEDRKKENAYLVKTAFSNEDIRKTLGDQRLEISTNLDVWAFGALLYCLCTGKNLFDVNRDNDINTFDAMDDLYNWNAVMREDKLVSVKDFHCRDLLHQILRKNRVVRPSISDILKHEFFNPKNIGDVYKKLDSIDHKLDSLAESMEALNLNLSKTNNMITTLLKGVQVPNLAYIVSEEEMEETWWTAFQKNTSLTVKCKICFLCPITFEIPRKNGKQMGYDVGLPKEWVKDYGPSILMTLRLSRMAMAAGRFAGFPGFSALEKGANAFTEKMSSVTRFANDILEDDAMKDLVEGNDFLSGGVGILSGKTGVGDAVKGAEKALTDALQKTKKDMIIKSSKKIKEIAEKHGDPTFEHSGLIEVTADDGTACYVHPGIESFFKEHGAKTFDMPSQRILKAFQEPAIPVMDDQPNNDAKKPEDCFCTIQ